jgi:hypothetical protein
MRVVQSILVCVALVVGSSTALGQFVKGNEAVKVMADGSKKVETPPLPSVPLGKPCPAAQAGCAGGGWLMVETTDGLVECTEIYARPGTCRSSTYGTEKRSRLWVVKAKSLWMQCQYPNLAGKCVSTKSLPTSAVQ